MAVIVPSSRRLSAESLAARLMLQELAAMVRADFGYPPSEAAPCLRESARCLGLIGLGDPERLNLLGWMWETAIEVPRSAELDRQQINQQIAELIPGWLS